MVHGVVQRPALRTIPHRDIQDLLAPNRFTSSLGYYVPVTGQLVHQCRMFGERCGENFSLAITLALISGSLIHKSSERDLREFREDIDRVMYGIEGMLVPESWRTDAAIMTNVARLADLADVNQFICLMEHCAEAEGALHLEEEDGGQESEEVEDDEITDCEDELEDDIENDIEDEMDGQMSDEIKHEIKAEIKKHTQAMRGRVRSCASKSPQARSKTNADSAPRHNSEGGAKGEEMNRAREEKSLHQHEIAWQTRTRHQVRKNQ